MDCVQYNDAREDLLTDLRTIAISNPSVQELLPGANDLNKDRNEELTYSVLACLLRSAL